MSKYISDWWIEELPNGVIKVIVNCTQKEIYYHAFNENEFLIAGTEEEFDSWNRDFILTVPKFLPEIEGVFLKSSFKEKDQLYFIYTPHLREWRKNRKILFEHE